MGIFIILSVFVTSGLAMPAENITEFEDEFHELWSDPEEEALAAKELADEEASIEQDKLGGLEGPIYPKGLIETPEAERTLSPEDQAYLNKIYEDMDREYIPSSYDARSYGLITTPKSQGSCGSCAAFAAMSTIETCMRRAGTPLDGLDLAEQHLVDCAYKSWMGQSKPDVSHEAQYPYLDRDPNLKCMGKPTWNTGAKVTSAITDYSCNEDKLKKLVYKYGAVATGIYASDNSFGNYAKGVFDTCSSTKMNHPVTVVGYGTESGKPYWVVKNSWGANWGDGGYIKIARGNSECGIGSQCALVECSKTGTASPAPQAPPPAPIPASQICDISNLYGTSSITGNYTLTTTINGKQYVANVKCTNSKCSPAVAGPSNACMYICGKTEC